VGDKDVSTFCGCFVTVGGNSDGPKVGVAVGEGEVGRAFVSLLRHFPLPQTPERIAAVNRKPTQRTMAETLKRLRDGCLTGVAHTIGVESSRSKVDTTCLDSESIPVRLISLVSLL